MKKFISFIILLTLLALPSCEKKCQHMYSKWSMDAEEHWISCDLCGEEKTGKKYESSEELNMVICEDCYGVMNEVMNSLD